MSAETDLLPLPRTLRHPSDADLAEHVQAYARANVARAREMLRALVLAAVPKHIEAEPENAQSYADGFNDAIDCTIANINALFEKENPQ